MLCIQRELIEHGLAATVEKYHLRVDELDGLVLLSYHQLDSPKTAPVVMECRGIVLEKNTWECISYPLHRFFNAGEAPQVCRANGFSYRYARVQQKIDGSLISVFPYMGEWRLATRGMIDARGPISFGNMTFAELFKKTVIWRTFVEKLNEGYCYYFELTSPFNKNVTPYEKSEVWLLTARKRSLWEEVSPEELAALCDPSWNMPETYLFHGSRAAFLAGELPATEEGYVAVDYHHYDLDRKSWPRLKIKNPAFVVLSHIKESSSLRRLLELVIMGDDAEAVTYFPEYSKTVAALRWRWFTFKDTLTRDMADMTFAFVGERTKEHRKRFAVEAQTKTLPDFLFAVYRGRAQSADDYFEQWVAKRGVTNLANTLLQRWDLTNVTTLDDNKDVCRI